MRILIVEDDIAGRLLLQKYLEPYGELSMAVDGIEAVEKFRQALEEKSPFSLIMLDIMLPKMDGQDSLKRIREIEAEFGIRPVDTVKVIMTTALWDSGNIIRAFNEGSADSYMVKPIEREKLIEELHKIGLVMEV